MSTKIFTGFKFNTTDFFEVREILASYREEVSEIVEEKMSSFLIIRSVEMFDHNMVEGNENGKDSFYTKAYFELLDRQREIKKTDVRDPAVDFEVSVVVLPFNGEFYGICYAESDKFYNLLLKDKRVSEFSYWNNTDRPKKITKKEWDARAKIWDGIFEKNSIPAEAGFTQIIHSGGAIPAMSNVEKLWRKFCPSFEERVDRWAENEYLNERVKGEKIDANNLGALFKYLNDKSPEAELFKEVCRVKLRALLKEDLHPEDVGIKFQPQRSHKLV